MLNELAETGKESKSNDFNALLNLNIKLYDGLSYQGTFSYHNSSTNQRDWKTEESHTELNQKLQKYFSSSQIEILLNGRSIVLSTLTPSIVKALLDMDQILSTPIHSLLPT